MALLVFLLWLAVGIVMVSKPVQAASTENRSSCPKLLGYTIVAEYPHDQQAFTQGLEFDRECNKEGKDCTEIFWESTGLYGHSTVRKVTLATGQVQQSLPLSRDYFAEGLVRLGDYLFQIVWQVGTIFKYTVADGVIKQVAKVQGPLRDGWGLTTNGTHLIATDSGSYLSFIEPNSLKEVRRVMVTDEGRPVRWLNELEYINGEVWANVWQSECIARINVTTGAITHWVLMHGLEHGLHLRHPEHRDMDVLNGIAHDPSTPGRVFVTGKKWSRIFEVRLKEAGPATPAQLQSARNQCIK